MDVDLEVRPNGREALDYLAQFSSAADPGVPELVLLDLNMPVMNGHEFLAELRGGHPLSAVPVVVLTTSDDETVHRTAEAQGANAVITKVDSLEGMSEIVNTIVDYWFASAAADRAADGAATCC